MLFGILPRLKEPIDFSATDGQAVDLVCLLRLSKKNEDDQLNALASVARRLRISEVLWEPRRAPNRALFYNAMMGRASRSK